MKNDKVLCLINGLLDLNFDNVFFDKKRKTFKLVDYEWRFSVPIPLKYIIFRSLTDFYFNYTYLNINRVVPLSYLLDKFKINEGNYLRFIKYEYNFQKYVLENFDKEYSKYKSEYIQIINKNSSLINHNDNNFSLLKKELKEKIYTLKVLEDQIKEKDKRICYLEEEQEKNFINYRKIIDDRDTEILSLERIVKGKEQENDLMSQDLKNAIREVQDMSIDYNQFQEFKSGLLWRALLRYRLLKRKSNTALRLIKFPLVHPLMSFEALKILLTEGRSGLVEKIYNMPIKSSTSYSHIDKSEEQFLASIEEINFEANKKPLVSIVIPVHNKWRYTYSCLRILKEKIKDISYEIIVVDNASTDETCMMFKKICNVNYLRNKKNLAFVGGCNLGAKAAKGKYVVFLNNDTLVTEKWLSSLVDTFKTNKRVGLVGSKLIYPNNKLQEAGGIVTRNRNIWNYGRLNDPNGYEYNYLKDVDYCSGASIMVSTSIFRKLNGFDKLYSPCYFEDTDLAFRVRRLGFRTLYQPKSELFHYEGITAGKDVNKGLKKYQIINKKKFFKRWNRILKKENLNDKDGLFLARDRSKDQKHVLFMDNCVPMYDKDAGSFIAFEYIKILRDMGYKIIFWPFNQAKIDPYTEELQQLGIEVVYGGVNFTDYICENGKFIDIAIISRPDVARAFLNDVKQYSKAKIMYLAVDLHFLREFRAAEVLKSTEENIMQNSDVSLFYSTKEVDLINKEFSNCKAEFIPWIQRIENRKPNEFRFRKGLIFLGNYYHPPNVDAVKWFHDQVFPILKEKIPDISVTLYGNNPPKDILDLHSIDFDVAGFLKEEEVINVYNSAKVFIAPIRFGAGFKGKIAKAMSHGLPVVTTNIGAEGMGVIDGENIMIADDAKGFAQKVEKVYKSKELWEKISKKSIEYIKNSYSIPNARKKLGRIISEIESKKQRRK